MSEAAAPSGLGPVAGSSWLLSDERLVRRAAEGDERAFAAIYRRYHQDLYRFCLAILGEPQDAQDALQTTMLKVMGALPGERRQIQLKPWLYRIAHNESVEVVRRRAPLDQLDPELAAAAPGPAEKAEQRARLRRLVTDMEQLPDRQRGALVMRELGGLGFEEIGAALETSPAVARQTLYEARLSLRQMEEGRELSCDAVTRALSDADGRVTRRRDIRAHLRECQDCREFREALRRRRRDFAAVTPLPAAAAAGILHGILGAGGTGAGGAAAGAAGSVAAGKALGGAALGTSALVKSAATVAVVAAIGVGAADRGGLVDVGLPGGDSSGAPASSEAGGASPKVGAGSLAPAGVQGPRAGDAGTGPASTQADRPNSDSPAAGTTAGAEETDAPGASAEHRNDAGRHGSPPASASHGQETASAHKGGAGSKGAANGKSGSGGGGAPAKGQAPHPPKPAHPAPPTSAGAQKPTAPAGAGAADTQQTAQPESQVGIGATPPTGVPTE